VFDLVRINYGVIDLLPKTLDAHETKQYNPICLINAVFKVITKLMTRRLSLIANKYIIPIQTAFILRRQILDDIVVLQEVLHDLKVNKKSGVI
jgi:hypothetical protein